MKERVESLIGLEKSQSILMGTFHAIATNFLRKYGKEIGISSNFLILDATDRYSNSFMIQFAFFFFSKKSINLI